MKTGIRLILMWIILLHVVKSIGAENLEQVEFTLSADFPKNISDIPLPQHFDKFGDSQNDCCTLVLFFEVKDLDMEGTGMDAPKLDRAHSQTETGNATFKIEHPDIRDTDILFTMAVAMDKGLVKSRHILNFDTCSSIVQKTFSIFATTSITDDKDVKVFLVNGKDNNIKCQYSTAIGPIPPITPNSNKYSKTTEILVIKAEVSLLTVGLAIMCSVSTLVSVFLFCTLVYVVKRYIPKIDTNSTEARYRNEKCVAGGDDSDDDNETCIVKEGGKRITKTGLEQRAKTIKKNLIKAAIFCLLLAIISVVAILIT